MSRSEPRRPRMIRSRAESVTLWILFAVFVVYALTLLYPFVWAFINSFKSKSEFAYEKFLLPKEWHFSNYAFAFSEMTIGSVPFYGAMINSIMLTALSTAAALMSSSFAAYALSKYEFRGRALIYSIAIFTMIIPVVGALPSQYRLVKDLNLDNMVGLAILGSSGFGFNFLILYGYFKSVSWSYAEAALVDGAGDGRIFFTIMLPQAKPSLIAVGIIAAIGVWNDYYTPLIYLGDSWPTLSYALYSFSSTMARDGNYPYFFAGSLIATLPIILLFIVFNDTIMTNTVAGGLKG